MLSSLMSEPPGRGSWEEDALCREYDSSLWLLSDNTEDRQLNKDRFEQAEVVCSKCPVFEQCWEAATRMDKRVTMRAGAWPLDYREPEDSATCSKGHDTSDPSATDSRGRCRVCYNEYMREYKRQRAAKKKAM